MEVQFSIFVTYSSSALHFYTIQSNITSAYNSLISSGLKVEQVQSEMKELSVLAESSDGDKEMQDLAREELQEARQKLLDLQEEVWDLQYCSVT